MCMTTKLRLHTRTGPIANKLSTILNQYFGISINHLFKMPITVIGRHSPFPWGPRFQRHRPSSRRNIMAHLARKHTLEPFTSQTNKISYVARLLQTRFSGYFISGTEYRTTFKIRNEETECLI